MKLRGSTFGQGARRIGIVPMLLLAACTGEIGASSYGPPGSTSSRVPGGSTSGTPGATTQVSCTSPSPGPSPLRRLTHREYDNTIRQLLGDTSDPAKAFAPEE